MSVLDSRRDRAALLLLLLGLGLLVALWPYATGLIGIPVLYVLLQPVHTWLSRHLHPRPAAGVVVLLAVFLLLGPGLSVAGILVAEAHDLAAGIFRSPILAHLSTVRVGSFDVGEELQSLGRSLAGWVSSSAFGLLGTATRLALNVTISLFGLFYLLLRPEEIWRAVQPYIPLSPANTERLRVRFRDITQATLIGTGLTALIQGILVGAGFWAMGLPNGLFWGVVTAIFSILPVVGSGLVWIPGAIALFVDGHLIRGIALVAWGLLAVANVDYLVRPAVARQWAQIHPLVTLVGAIAAVPYLGLLGLLVGPLALSYFFELVRMYREEFGAASPGLPAA